MDNLLGEIQHMHIKYLNYKKKLVSVRSVVGLRSSCRNLFRNLNILLIAFQYILPLVLLMVDNQKYFLTNAYVQGLDTRNKNYLYLPVVSLSCFQKGVSYSWVKFFNSLPSNIQSYRNDRKRLRNKLYRYLIIHSFYSITEFFECKIDKDNT